MILNENNVHKKLKIMQFLIACFLLFLFVVLLFGSPLLCVSKNKIFFAEEQTEAVKKKYAKAKQNCFLFKTTDISSSVYSNVYFCVPESYFVTILQEVSSAVLKVEYRGKIGFVASDTVTVATFVPIVPTLDDIYCDVVSISGTQLRTSPSAENSNNILTILPSSTKNLEYIALCYGLKPNGGNSDEWIYVYYYPESDPTSVYEGYVYSEKICNISPIAINKENNPEIEKEVEKEDVDVSKNVKIILLVLILLPVVLVFVLVAFRSKNHFQKSADESKNVDENLQPEMRKKSVRSLVGKKLVRKQNDDDESVEFETEINGVSPSFPTYDIVDDDDLL